MLTKVQVQLNNKALHDIDYSVIVQRVDENAPNTADTTTGLGGGVGSWRSGVQRQWLDVTVEFSLANINRYEERVDVLDRIRAWAAGGGTLKTNYRSGKALYVQAVELPAGGYVREWTKNYTIRFRACGVPYWVDAAKTTQTVKNISSRVLTVTQGGTADAPLEFNVTNNGSKNVDTVRIGGMVFEGLALLTGESLQVSYDNATGLQRIRRKRADGSTGNAMACRALASADDVWLKPGENEVAFESNRPVTVDLITRGRYL